MAWEILRVCLHLKKVKFCLGQRYTVNTCKYKIWQRWSPSTSIFDFSRVACGRPAADAPVAFVRRSSRARYPGLARIENRTSHWRESRVMSRHVETCGDCQRRDLRATSRGLTMATLFLYSFVASNFQQLKTWIIINYPFHHRFPAPPSLFWVSYFMSYQ